MLRLPSVQGQYDTYWSGDPVFTQPDETDECALRGHADKLKRAHETGDWAPLLKDGEVLEHASKFVMQPLKGRQLRWLIDQTRRNDEHQIGNAQLGSLVFRCAFVSVKDLDLDRKEKSFKHPDLGTIASSDVTDVLDRIDQGIVVELAAHAFQKAQALNPL